MGRGLLNSLFTHPATLLLANAARLAFASSIWDVHIDESPAPPPSEGPPLSAHASRNPALIPYQVIGIVGAYIGCILLVGSFLFTVGRSRRKQAQRMAAEPTEMVKPTAHTYTFEQSPVSPGAGAGAKHWYSSRRLRDVKSTSGSMRSAGEQDVDGISPSVASVASFDTTVLEADRRQRQVEMERLYAAVLAQDDARNGSEGDAVGTAYTTDMPPEYEYSRRSPPRLATPATNWQSQTLQQQQQQQQQSENVTPKTPVRAIYPPDKDLPPGPHSATSPVKAEYTQPHPPIPSSTHTRNPSSSSSNNNAAKPPPTGPGGKLRKSLRNIKISSPLPYHAADNEGGEHSDNDRTPLSPRWYADPGPPPEPPTPGTSRSAAFPAEHYAYQADPRGLPPTAPQRQGGQSGHAYQTPAPLVTDLGTRRLPDPTKSTTTTTAPMAPRSNNTLPLRELNRQYAALQQTQQMPQTAAARSFPLSPSHWNPLSPSAHHKHYATSAGPTKTTFLEARRDNFSSGPRTGAPTPYSPYMPFTPLTPVTPHLTSKAERKQREREERKLRRPIVEEEMVREEGELWGDGY